MTIFKSNFLKLRLTWNLALLGLLVLLLLLNNINGHQDFQFDSNTDDDVLQVDLTFPNENGLFGVETNGNDEDDINSQISLYEKEMKKCSGKDVKTMLAILLDNKSWNEIDDKKRESALERLSKFFAIPKEFITYEDVNGIDRYDMLKNSITKSPNASNSNKRRLGKIEFMIGCNGILSEFGRLIAAQITEEMHDDSISDISGVDFNSFIIWRKKINNRVPRNKRETDPDEGSGEAEYDDDYYDEDEEDPITEDPIVVHPHRHQHGDDNTQHNNDRHDNFDKSILSNDDKVDKNKKNNKINSNTNNNNSNNNQIKKNKIHNIIITTTEQNSLVDLDIQESVSKLESDITKTIENANKLFDGKHSRKLSTSEIVDDTSNGEDIIEDVNYYGKSSKNDVTNVIDEPQHSDGGTTSADDVIDNEDDVEDNVDDNNDGNTNTDNIDDVNNAKEDYVIEDNGQILTDSPITKILVSTAITTKSDAPIVKVSQIPPTSTLPSTLLSLSSTTASSSSISLSSSTSPPSTKLSTTTLPIISTLPIFTDKLTDDDVLATNLPTTLLFSSTSSRPYHIVPTIKNKTTDDGIDMAVVTTTLINPIIIQTSTTAKPLLVEQTLKTIPLTVTSTTNENLVIVTDPSTIPPRKSNQSQVPPPEEPLPEYDEDEYPDYDEDEDEDLELDTNKIIPPVTNTSSPMLTSSAPTQRTSTIIETTQSSSTTSKMVETSPETIPTTPSTTSTLTSIIIPNTTITITSPSTTSSTTTTSTSTTTTTTTTLKPTTTSTTEFIELEPINYPPTIRNRLAKQAVTAGIPFKIIVPIDTFYDEDGTHLKLTLLDKHSHPLKSNSWIKFNSHTREIYGLPLEDVVSKHQFKLVATDSGNESTFEIFDITVQQHKAYRSANHEISIGVKLSDNLRNTVDWPIMLIDGIVKSLGDNSISSIIVREIRSSIQDINAATFIYTNETLPKDRCPEEKLDNLLERLTVKNLTETTSKEISIKFVHGKPIGQCLKQEQIKPKPPKQTDYTRNYAPVPRNQVDRVNATVGQLLVYKVPKDTFYDPEDNTDLKLSLLSKDRKQLEPLHWLQFDSKNQEFYGIPKLSDAGETEYLLIAEDRDGLTATDALVVVVNPAIHREYNNLFEMTLGITYDDFNNSNVQRRFIERLAAIFGDSTDNIQVRAIRKVHPSGKTIIQYYNTTLYRPQYICPTEDIQDLKNIFQHLDGAIRHSVLETIGSEFNLTKINFKPMGACEPTPEENNIQHAIIPIKTDKTPSKSFKDDYLLTFVLPAVIIIAMLLIAAIIACILHRRRITGKMELGDEEERRSFRSKGIPVIFQDELDEKLEISNKSPIILKDEKPPLLPPSYNSTNPDDHDDMDEYVPPPAVVVGGRETRGKSPVTPSYRKPPPYVSP